ncbi:MAG: 2-isopropylmalate synthase [Spirochaetaceae bacterium]|jgi:2-isopropylmalate synthase|nr:2-isopropylmalate synthase [Spirochaetaceae bacterium]
MPKYQPLPRVKMTKRSWPDNQLTQAPLWCSVDLRDGNQALAVPMGVEDKLRLFECLVNIGFKEIEVGFPSASQTEFDFIRRLIDENRVPKDVALQILTPAREWHIKRSMEALKGAENVIIHLYNSTSWLQRKITFNMDKDQIKELAVLGTQMVKENLSILKDSQRVVLQYSPESFSDTEMDYALEICEAVLAQWDQATGERVIINLPETVQWAGPHIYADQIEWFCRHLKNRENVIISVHTHNDRGTGVAATELALLAGADRVEGTLFGNGERTGNLDLVTQALNLYTDGIDSQLDFTNLPEIQRVYEETTGMSIDPRHPYAGELVFTAFSGSHQDAIKKGLDAQEKKENPTALWEVPYLPIDPRDIGKDYEAIIRINSQSGKGGAAYILSSQYNLELPKKMQPLFGQRVNSMADQRGRELEHSEIYQLLEEEFIQVEDPLKLDHLTWNFSDDSGQRVLCKAEVSYQGETHSLRGGGNGPLDAFVAALREKKWKDFTLSSFHEHAMDSGSQSQAAAYIELADQMELSSWGMGMDSNIDRAGIKAIISAFNNHKK